MTTLDELVAVAFGDKRLPDRFWSKIRVSESGCWEWTASLNRNGYGSIRTNRRTVVAHRFAYSALIGAVPVGLDLDHLCRVRACCNPAHLEPVTRSINIFRGDGPRKSRERGAAVTHCPAGHEYATHAWIDKKKNARHCRLCHKARQVAARLARAKTAAGVP